VGDREFYERAIKRGETRIDSYPFARKTPSSQGGDIRRRPNMARSPIVHSIHFTEIRYKGEISPLCSLEPEVRGSGEKVPE